MSCPKMHVQSLRLACLAILIFASASALAGCDNEKGEPEIDYSEGLVGPDQNGNGVRDDVDAYIRENYSGDLRNALSQYAESQTELLLESGNPEAAIRGIEKMYKDMGCVYGVSPDEANESVKRVRAEILSTEERSRAYAQASAHAGGETFMLPRQSELRNGCEF